MMSEGIINIILLALLITLGFYVFRLNRKIDRLRAALLEIGPTLKAYEGAISNHKESLNNFSERLGETEKTSAGIVEDDEDDLSRVFYGTFGKEVK